jgi:hypothetical protein
MADQHIAAYLNDHLAGSVTAIELLEHLEKTFTGTATGRFAAELRADILLRRGALPAPPLARYLYESRSTTG